MEFGYLNSVRKSTIVIFVEFPTLVWSCVANSVTDVSVVSGQHGVSIQVTSVLMWQKKFVRISCIRVEKLQCPESWRESLFFFLFPDY